MTWKSIVWLDWRHNAAKREALGYFLELTDQLGPDRRLVVAARALRDRRRTRERLFFTTLRLRHGLALARRNTPRLARKWGYLMNMGLDTFADSFAKHTHGQHEALRSA